MALPTKSSPKAVELIEHKGRGFAVKYRGENARHDMANGHHHLDAQTMYQPPGDGPPISALDAFHGKALPPALIKEIAAAVAALLGLDNVHQYAGSDQAMPDMTEATPDTGMPQGLPTGRMAA